MYVFCMDLRTSGNLTLNSINRLVSISRVESVYCAVHTNSFYKTDMFHFEKVMMSPRLKCKMNCYDYMP